MEAAQSVKGTSGWATAVCVVEVAEDVDVSELVLDLTQDGVKLCCLPPVALKRNWVPRR